MRPRMILFIATFSAVIGCNDFPRDSTGTLADVKNDTLHAGISHNIHYAEDSAFIHRFAATLGARVIWRHGDHHYLADMLEEQELDLAIGGFTTKSPYDDKAALSKPYRIIEAEKTKEEYVIAVQKGENAFLVALEKFIHDEMEQGQKQ